MKSWLAGALGSIVLAVGFTAADDASLPVTTAASRFRSVQDDTANLGRLLSAVRGVDPIACELASFAVGNGWGMTPVGMLLEPAEESRVRDVVSWATSHPQDPALVRPLRAALDDGDACTARTAARVLGSMRTAAAVDALLDAIGQTSRGTRLAGLIGIGHAETRRAVQPLLMMLRDGDPLIRRGSAWALGRIEDPAAIPALTQLLGSDADPVVRRTAAWALGNFD